MRQSLLLLLRHASIPFDNEFIWGSPESCGIPRLQDNVVDYHPYIKHPQINILLSKITDEITKLDIYPLSAVSWYKRCVVLYQSIKRMMHMSKLILNPHRNNIYNFCNSYENNINIHKTRLRIHKPDWDPHNRAHISASRSSYGVSVMRMWVKLDLVISTPHYI